MNREFQRRTDKSEPEPAVSAPFDRSSSGTTKGEVPAPRRPAKRERTGVAQFLREVRAELKRVNWPSRREVASYSTVVLVAVSLVTLYIFGLDTVFGRFVLWIFG